MIEGFKQAVLWLNMKARLSLAVEEETLAAQAEKLIVRVLEFLRCLNACQVRSLMCKVQIPGQENLGYWNMGQVYLDGCLKDVDIETPLGPLSLQKYLTFP